MTLNQRETSPGAFEVEIVYADLTIPKTDIERRLGYATESAPLVFSDMINEALAAAETALAVRAGYVLKPLRRPEDRRDGLQAGGVFFHTSNIVASELSAAAAAALFVCTIGPGLENRAAELTRGGDPARGYIMDTVASELAERTAGALHDHIAAVEAGRGRGVTNRYSPGYCNWPVAEQHLLFSLLPPGFCGVTLTESALMVPVKSVSGIIGVGEGVERRPYRCDRCGVAECLYRNTRLAEKGRKS